MGEFGVVVAGEVGRASGLDPDGQVFQEACPAGLGVFGAVEA